MSTKRKCPTELNIKIKIKKYFENVNLAITVAKSDRSKKTKEIVTCTPQNSQNSTIDDNFHLTSEQKVLLMQDALNSSVLVDALEPIAVLEKKCARFGIKANFGYQRTHKERNPITYGYGRYAVERILDYDTVNYLYLIKWKGYDSTYNTWEPVDHLDGVAHLAFDFRLMERRLSEYDKKSYKKLVLLSCLLNDLVSPTNTDPFILLKMNGKSASQYRPGDLYDLKRKVNIKNVSLQRCLKEDEKKFQFNYGRILEKTMKDLLITVAFESIVKFEAAIMHRKAFFKCLKTHEAKINCSIKELEDYGYASTIEIENNCDFDLPPDDFTYITKCRSGLDVIVSQEEEPSWFCHCHDCFSNTRTCCPNMNGSYRIYNKYGSLKNLKQNTIFECNSKCKCSSTCANRVIQNGPKFKLGIFKTDDDRGWGVKALERIPKGKFIVEYVGEVITKSEAERRSENGENPYHKSYLFDLEFEIGTHCDYVVDGAKFGNLSRFINHSCSPNMEVYMFWIDNPDLKVPRIAFFSQTCIASGEEITIDYRMDWSAPGTVRTKKDIASVIRVPCKCRSSKCRKFLF